MVSGIYLAAAMGRRYVQTLDRGLGIRMVVEFTTEGRDITDYAVVLVRGRGTQAETIRIYDGAHGYNEMHRHTSGGGKQPGTRFHSGTLGEGMRAAIAQTKDSYPRMIEGWERQ